MDKRFFVHTPGSTYASNFYGRTKQEAMAAFRAWAGVKRAPRGTVIWEQD